MKHCPFPQGVHSVMWMHHYCRWKTIYRRALSLSTKDWRRHPLAELKHWRLARAERSRPVQLSAEVHRASGCRGAWPQVVLPLSSWALKGFLLHCTPSWRFLLALDWRHKTLVDSRHLRRATNMKQRNWNKQTEPQHKQRKCRMEKTQWWTSSHITKMECYFNYMTRTSENKKNTLGIKEDSWTWKQTNRTKNTYAKVLGRNGSDRPQADGLKFKGKFFRGKSIKPN